MIAVPLIQRSIKPVAIVLGVGAVGTGIYFAVRSIRAANAMKDLATSADARHAAMYMKVLDQGSVLDRLLAKVPGVKQVNDALDTVSGWFGKNKSEKVNLITARLFVWDDVVKYFKAFTGKSLNKTLQAQLSEKEYESFVNTLANNRNAVNSATGKQNTAATIDANIAKMVAVVMSKTPGKTFSIGNAGNVQNWKVTAAKSTRYWLQPGGPKKQVDIKPGEFLGNPSGRFHNHDGKLALVEFNSKAGVFWGILGDHTIWTPKT